MTFRKADLMLAEGKDGGALIVSGKDILATFDREAWDQVMEDCLAKDTLPDPRRAYDALTRSEPIAFDSLAAVDSAAEWGVGST